MFLNSLLKYSYISFPQSKMQLAMSTFKTAALICTQEDLGVYKVGTATTRTTEKSGATVYGGVA
jgi:hypothetical protein